MMRCVRRYVSRHGSAERCWIRQARKAGGEDAVNTASGGVGFADLPRCGGDSFVVAVVDDGATKAVMPRSSRQQDRLKSDAIRVAAPPVRFSTKSSQKSGAAANIASTAAPVKSDRSKDGRRTGLRRLRRRLHDRGGRGCRGNGCRRRRARRASDGPRPRQRARSW